MRLTVCELPDDAERRTVAWAELAEHLRRSPTEILVLPEMPFAPWKTFTTRLIDRAVWDGIVADHDAMLVRFAELSAEVIIGSRPVQEDGRRLNQGFAWTRTAGVRTGRSKVYLPDAPDGWEATWFARGTLDPAPLVCNGVRVGFQVCTEMLFTDLAWRIGRAGADLIAAPRATSGHRRWRLAAALMGIVSGCFVASANRRSYETDDFAGHSWIVSPEGDILAETTPDAPVATISIDLADVTLAKRTYPRNLPE